jgi:hypothetical protein
LHPEGGNFDRTLTEKRKKEERKQKESTTKEKEGGIYVTPPRSRL